MKRLAIAIALCLPACSTTGMTPSLTQAGQLALKKAETSAEVAFSVVEQAYIAGEDYLNAHPAQKAQAKALVEQGHEALLAARSAETVGDTATITAKITAIENIKAQIVALTGK